MSKTQNKLAVVIDADNANRNNVDGLMAEIAKYGIASVKRIYGDFSSPQLASWKEILLSHGIVPIQQFAYTKGKNSTDSAMIIDAMDLLHTGNYDGFCIVSSDSDFTRLASRIRENGLTVYGFGEKKTPISFVRSCDTFVYVENLRHEIEDIRDINDVTPIDTRDLKRETKLVKLLRDATEDCADLNGWSNLAQVGQNINNYSSDFDPRNWGYNKLIDLIEAMNLFEMDIEQNEANQKITKKIYIKDKRKKIRNDNW